MPFDLGRFSDLRPCLFHLTARANVGRIIADGALTSAAALLTLAGLEDQVVVRRRAHVPVMIGPDRVLLRDQAPLHAGSIRFESGIAFPDVVRLLNERVFFWPGTKGGPIESGRRHFLRYAEEETAVLVMDTRAAFAANSESPPQFAKYNTGSPRCNGGLGSPRGRSTFMPASSFQGRPSQVIEVTFQDQMRLPTGAVAVTDIGRWL